MKNNFKTTHADLKDFILDIDKHFNSSNVSIHKARNEIKEVKFNNKIVIVKSFKILSFFRKIIYTFFQSSKAKRSYEYSLKLGDFAPKPLAFIEFFKNGLLEKSFFVCEKFEYDFTIREVLFDKNIANKELILKQFAHFANNLHNNGIYHLDFSPGNILIKKYENNYIFKIVDLNRMKFLALNLQERMKNFSMLWADDEDLKIIVKEYAKLINQNEEKCIELACFYSKRHKNIKNFKKQLRAKICLF